MIGLGGRWWCWPVVVVDFLAGNDVFHTILSKLSNQFKPTIDAKLCSILTLRT